MSLGFSEILLIIVVILILFGSKRIPEVARALGKASHEFKKAKEALRTESEELIAAAEKAAEDEEKNAEKAKNTTNGNNA